VNRTYVYKHLDPRSGETLYVGLGQDERAWTLLHRKQDHVEYMRSLEVHGYCPGDWVEIVQKGLSRAEGFRLEADLIRALTPRFNQVGVDPSIYKRGAAHPKAKLTEKDVRLIRSRISSGLTTVRQVAREFGMDSGTISRLVQGKTWSHVR